MARAAVTAALLICLLGQAHASCSAAMRQMSSCTNGTVTTTNQIPVVATAPGSACDQYGQKDVYCDSNLTYYRTRCTAGSNCNTSCQTE
eukprot:4054612-Alexandrium_andersonii.AAC.1